MESFLASGQSGSTYTLNGDLGTCTPSNLMPMVYSPGRGGGDLRLWGFGGFGGLSGDKSLEVRKRV